MKLFFALCWLSVLALQPATILAQDGRERAGRPLIWRKISDEDNPQAKPLLKPDNLSGIALNKNNKDENESLKKNRETDPTPPTGDFILVDNDDSISTTNLIPGTRTLESIEQTVDQYNKEVADKCFAAKNALLNHMENVFNRTKVNIKIRANADYNHVKANFWRKLKDVEIGPLNQDNPTLGQTVGLIVEEVGIASLPNVDAQELQIAMASLEESYRKRTVERYEDKGDDSTQPRKFSVQDVDETLSQNRSYDEKLYYWTEWHRATDNQSIENLAIYAHTLNKAAKLQGLRDGSKLLQKPYHDPNLETTMRKLWEEVQPLYTLLRKHVQHKLKENYGDTYKHKGKYIPAHLVGSIKGDSWRSLHALLKPYPCLPEQGQAPGNGSVLDYCRKSAQLANSAHVPRDPAICDAVIRTFHNDGKSECHPKAYDFCNGQSYILTVCEDDPFHERDAHRELEKLFYALSYGKQRFIFRDNPHPGIEEAFAYLFASQTERLIRGDGQLTPEQELNDLLDEAINVLPELSYSMALEKFRWDLGLGNIPKSKWNEHWWNLRRKYEGIEPPNYGPVGEFDPAANYDVIMDIDQSPRFLGLIMYYQLLHAACPDATTRVCTKEAVRTIKQPLHQCNLYGKTIIGDKIRTAQSLGHTVDWEDIWLNLTGSKQISARALLDYYEPVQRYLQENQQENNGYWIALGIGILIIIVVCIIAILYAVKKLRGKKAKEEKKKLESAEEGAPPTEQGNDNKGLETQEKAEIHENK